MIRSLYSGVSGMKNHQTRMDVTANNIANVNTTAYKSGRVNFKDVLGQTIDGGQVGSGITIAGIDNNFTQGSQTATGKPTDLYIQGNGFFVVQDVNGVQYYTRDGSFHVDEAGNLVNSLGYGVCDSAGSPITGITPPIDSIRIERNGEIFVNGSTTATATIGLAQFEDSQKLARQGENLYIYNGTNPPTIASPGTSGYGAVISNNLEMSNVDLTDEFANMITTQRGYQANARIITTSDEMLQEVMGLKR